jgi:flagellar basal-body rod protein FlgB
MDTTWTGAGVLAQVLDASALRHRVIAQNVANINTPGYRRLAVQFESDLARALNASTSTRAVKPQVVVADGPERVDGNTVDIDQEMNDLSRNALLYEAASQVLVTRLAMMRSAITGR